jgi:hypothetical protein
MHFHLVTTNNGVIDNDYQFDKLDDAVSFFIRTVNMFENFVEDEGLVRDGFSKALAANKALLFRTTIPLVFYKCAEQCEFTNELKASRN